MFLKYCSDSTTPSAGEGGACVPPCGAACPVTFARPATLNASAAHTFIATPIDLRFTLIPPSPDWREIGARIPPDFKWEERELSLTFQVRLHINKSERLPRRCWIDSQKWRVLLRPRLYSDKLDEAMRD
jgi:hypothetical protein